MDIGVARGEIQIETGQALASLQGLGAALRAADQMGAGAMQQTGMQIQQVGLAWQQAGRVGIGIGTGLAAPLVMATKAAIGFESQMAGVNAVMDLTDEQFHQLSELASQLGQDSIFSGEQAAAGIETLGKAGISAEDILGGAARGVVNLAAAAETTTTQAAEVMSAALSQFGLGGDQAEHVADVITGAANSSLMDIGDFGIGLSQVGGIAAAAGMTFEETAAYMALMGDMGLSGSDAATSMKTAILALLSPTDKAAGFMEDWGIAVTDTAGQFIGLEGASQQFFDAWKTSGMSMAEFMEPIEDIMGRDAVRTIIAGMQAIENGVTGTGKSFEFYHDAVNDAGAAQRIAEDRMDSTAGALERLRGSLSVLGERVGAPILDVLRPVIEFADKLVDALANLPAPILAAGAALTGLAATLTLVGGAGLFAAGHIVEAIGRLASVGVSVPALAASVGSLIPIILAVTAAIAGLAIAWEHDFLGMRTTVEGFIGGIQDRISELNTIMDNMGYEGMSRGIYMLADAMNALGAEEFARKLRVAAGAIADFLKIREELYEEEAKIPAPDPQSNPILGMIPRDGERELNFLENLKINLEAGARAAENWIGRGNGLSKTLRNMSKGADAFASEWDKLQGWGISGITSATSGLAKFAEAMGWTGLAGALNTAAGYMAAFEVGVRNMIDAGMNPASAVITSLGQQIQSITGLPVAQTMAEWALALDQGLAVAANAVQNGLSPIEGILLGISYAARSLGFEDFADTMYKVAGAAGVFGDSFQAAIDSGLNPFHAAALSLADALDFLAGEETGVSNAIRNISSTIEEFVDGIEPKVRQFGETWRDTYDQWRFIGEAPLQAGIRATAAALGELLGIDLSQQAQGIVDFTNTLGALKDALLAGDWSGAADAIRSAIDQVVGAVQSLNIPEVVVNIGSFVLGTIEQTIGDFIDGLLGQGTGGGSTPSSGEELRGSGAYNAGHWIRGIVLNVGEWAEGTIESISDTVKPWIEERIEGARSALETTIDAIKVNVGGWIVDIVEGARDLVTAVKEWAMGGSYDSMGGPGERGEAGTNTGAIEIAVGAITATVSGWLVKAAEGIGTLVEKVKEWALGNAPDSTGGPGERGEAGTGEGALEVVFGAVTATVSGWIVQLADGARSLMEEVEAWAKGGAGESQSVLGPGGELTGPDGRSGGRSGGALVELGKITASIAGWVIENVGSLWDDIKLKAQEEIPKLQFIPFEEIRANILSWAIETSADIAQAINDFIQGESGGPGSGPWEAHGANQGAGGGFPIDSIPINILSFVVNFAGTTATLVASIAAMVVDVLDKIEFSQEDLAAAGFSGEELGAVVGEAIFGSLNDYTQSEAAQNAAYEAGKNAPGLADMARQYVKGMFESFSDAFDREIIGVGLDPFNIFSGKSPFTEVEGGDNALLARGVYAVFDKLLPDWGAWAAESREYQAYVENARTLGEDVADSGVVQFREGFEDRAGDATELKPWVLPDMQASTPNVQVDASEANIDVENPPSEAMVGIPITITPDGLFYNANTGSPIQPTPEMLAYLEQGVTAGQMMITPNGVIIDPAGTPILFGADGMPQNVEAGQPITLTANRGIYVDAEGNTIQASPATQAMWDAMWAGDSGGTGFFANESNQLMYRLPNGTEVVVQVPDSAFVGVGDAIDEGVAGDVENNDMPESIRTIGEKKQKIIDEFGRDIGITSLPNTGTGTGIGPALDALIAGEITEAEFLQVTAQLGTKMGEAVTQAFTSFSTGNYGGSGQMQAGGIGNSIMTNLATSIQTAPTEGLSAALKAKISEALSQGMSESGGQAAEGASAAAGGIGSSVVSSLVSAISSADFAAVGNAISMKIGQALQAGMTTAGGQAGGAGAAGGAGGGVGTSVANALASAISGADFTAIGQAISLKLGESLSGVEGEGLATALQGVFDALAASATSMAASLQPVGAAIIQGIASGTGTATATLQSAVTAVISATVASASAAASGSTPPVGTAFVTGSASGVGSATGTFQSAVDAMIQAVVSSGSATASSSAQQVGTSFAEGAGAGIGPATGTFQSAVEAMVNAAVDAGIAAAGRASEIGAAISSGAAAGIDIEALVGPAVQMVEAAINAANERAKSQSPSRVFMEIGGWLSEGAAIGIEEKTRMVADASRNMVQAAIDETSGLKDIGTKMGESTKSVNQDLKGINEIANILDQAPGWNKYGDILRSSSEGIKDSVKSMREDVKDLVQSVKEQIKDMASELRRLGEESGRAIGEGISSGTSGAGSGIGSSIEKGINSEIAGINIDDFVIDRDMFKTAKQGVGELRGVGKEISKIEEVARILDAAPGWNNFGDVLRDAAGNIEGHVGGARDKFRDIMKNMNEITRTQTKAITDAIKQLAESIGGLASSAGEEIGRGMSSGMSSGSEATESAGSDMAYGSVGAIESTIENLKGNLKNAGMGAGQALGGGMQQTSGDLNQIGNEVGQSLGDGATQGLQESTEGAGETAGQAGADLGNSFNNGVASSIPTAQELGSQISQSVLESLQASAIADSEAVRMIGEAFGNAFGQGVASATPEATQAGQGLTDATETGMTQGVESAGQTATGVGNEIGNDLGTGIQQACKPVNNAARDLTAECAGGGIEAGEGQAVKAAESTGESVGEGVADGMDAAGRDVEKAGKALGLDSVKSVQETINNNKNMMKTSVFDMVKNAQIDPTAQSKPVGVDFIAGMESGLDAESGSLYEKVREIVDKAIKEAEAEADAQSPSRRTMQLGEWMGQGVELGLAAQEDPVIKTMRNIVDGAINAAHVGEVAVGTLTMEAIGERLKWTSAQVDDMLSRSTDRRMRLMETWSGNIKGRDAAKDKDRQTPIQIGDIVIEEGQPGYNEARGFIDAINRNYPAYYGTRRR